MHLFKRRRTDHSTFKLPPVLANLETRKDGSSNSYFQEDRKDLRMSSAAASAGFDSSRREGKDSKSRSSRRRLFPNLSSSSRTSKEPTRVQTTLTAPVSSSRPTQYRSSRSTSTIPGEVIRPDGDNEEHYVPISSGGCVECKTQYPHAVVFLQLGSEMKRSVLPGEPVSQDMLRNMFARSYPRQLTAAMLSSSSLIICILDPTKNIFLPLNDLSLVVDRCVLRLIDTEATAMQPMAEATAVQSLSSGETMWLHGINRQPGHSAIRPLDRGYRQSTENGEQNGGCFGRHINRPILPPPGTDRTVKTLTSAPDRICSGSYLHTHTVSTNPIAACMTAAPSVGDIFCHQCQVPVMDHEARVRVEQMEQQLASLTGLLQKALTTPLHSLEDNISCSIARRDCSRLGKPDARPISANSSFEGELEILPTNNDVGGATLKKTSRYPSLGRCRERPTLEKSVSFQDNHPSPSSCIYNRHSEAACTQRLRVLHRRALDLTQQYHKLRQLALDQAQSTKNIIQDAESKIMQCLGSTVRHLQLSGSSCDEMTSFRRDVLLVETTLGEVERGVDLLRHGAIVQGLRVSSSDVDSMTSKLHQSSEWLSRLRTKFDRLQSHLCGQIISSREHIRSEERFILEQPKRLEHVQNRIQKFYLTLITLRRLASVYATRCDSQEVAISSAPTSSSSRRAKIRWRQSSLFKEKVDGNDCVRAPPVRALSLPPPLERHRSRPKLTETLSMPF